MFVGNDQHSPVKVVEQSSGSTTPLVRRKIEDALSWAELQSQRVTHFTTQANISLRFSIVTVMHDEQWLLLLKSMRWKTVLTTLFSLTSNRKLPRYIFSPSNPRFLDSFLKTYFDNYEHGHICIVGLLKITSRIHKHTVHCAIIYEDRVCTVPLWAIFEHILILSNGFMRDIFQSTVAETICSMTLPVSQITEILSNNRGQHSCWQLCAVRLSCCNEANPSNWVVFHLQKPETLHFYHSLK